MVAGCLSSNYISRVIYSCRCQGRKCLTVRCIGRLRRPLSSSGRSRNMPPTLAAWTSHASHLIGECFDAGKPMLEDGYAGLPPLARFVCAQLSIDCNLSSESVLLLIRAEKEWDADLIARSVMEGSFKLTYMLQGSYAEIEEKANEFWHVLPLFYAIRHGENAKKMCEHLHDPNAPEWRPLQDLRISEDKVAEIRTRYSRSQRQALEEKWSFVGLCRSFAESENPGLKAFAGLSHGYTMSSHLLHKDADGIGMVWERYGRSPERQLAVRMGHSARVVSDICSFGKLRLFALLRACGGSRDLLRAIESRYQHLDGALSAAIARFNEVEYDPAV